MELNYNNYLKNLNDDDVVEQNERLFKYKKIKETVEMAFDQAIPNALNTHFSNNKVHIELQQANEWFDSGVDCKILQAGSSGWKSGKLKINVTVEFIPDPPPTIESPLDEIRREIQGS